MGKKLELNSSHHHITDFGAWLCEKQGGKRDCKSETVLWAVKESKFRALHNSGVLTRHKFKCAQGMQLLVVDVCWTMGLMLWKVCLLYNDPRLG